MVLDLHGLHTDEAVAALKQVIAEKEKGDWFQSVFLPSIIVFLF